MSFNGHLTLTHRQQQWRERLAMSKWRVRDWIAFRRDQAKLAREFLPIRPIWHRREDRGL